jgi:Cu+-exporting ATPase
MPDQKEKSIPINEIQIGDEILLKPGEIIPVDAEVLMRSAILDYSFVTGESRAVVSKKGAQVFAGAKVKNRTLRVKATKSLNQSYLIQLWNQKEEGASTPGKNLSMADRLSRYFTPVVLLISIFSGTFWAWADSSKVIEVMAAVLIVACPCALALSGPFVLGNMLRYLGRIGFYIKNTHALLRITATDHWVFDKTGTLTEINNEFISFKGIQPLREWEKEGICALVYTSNHPLSRAIFSHLKPTRWLREIEVKQYIGYGLEGVIEGRVFQLGSKAFIGDTVLEEESHSAVHLSIDGKHRGCFEIEQIFRKNINNLFNKLQKRPLSILSGDGPYEAEFLKEITPPQTKLLFDQNPFDKINYIKKLKKKHQVLMFGDGLNDAGALRESDAGIAISNETHLFTPACDAILMGNRISRFPEIFETLKKSILLVRLSFVFSLIYNLLGISIAALGYLTPIIAAILMPLSSVSVVLFATLSTALLYKRLRKKLGN